jgi:hypothetical protein
MTPIPRVLSPAQSRNAGQKMATEKAPVREDCQTNPAEAGCAYLEMTLMNFDYGGTVNFFAIIIGN